MNLPKFTSKIRVRGRFWALADDEVIGGQSDQVAGYFHYDPTRGARIRVVHTLKTQAAGDPIDGMHVLYGMTSRNWHVSATGAFRTNWNTGTSGVHHEQWYANRAYVGTHFVEFPTDRVTGVSLEVQSLNEFAHVGPSAPTWDESMRNVTASTTLPPPEAVKIDDKLDVALESYTTLSQLTDRVKMQVETRWTASLASGISLSDADDVALSLERYSCVLAAHPLRARGIMYRLHSENNSQIAPYVSVLSARRSHRLSRRILRHEMLFTRQSLGGAYAETLRRWYALHQKARTSYDIFFSTFQDRPPLLEIRLISMTQALEAFHRRLESGEYVDAGEYDIMRSQLCSAIPPNAPPDLRQSLKDRLRYGNEKSQRRRLKDLVRSLPQAVCDAAFPDASAYADQIIDARNHFTHYPDDAGWLRRSPRDVALWVERSYLLLLLLTYHHVGIPENQIVESLARWNPLLRSIGHLRQESS